MREVRLVNFNKNKGVSLVTLEFDVKKEGKTKTVVRNIATRCKNEDDFKERLKTNDYCDGVVIIGFINTDEGIKIPLIQEFKEIVGDYIWTFPAGQVEKGEDVKITALRELKEETGLETTIDDITVFKPTYTSVGIIDQRISLAVLECHGTPTDKYLTPGEDIKIHLLTLKEIEDLIQGDEEIAGNTKLVLSLIAYTNGDIEKIKKILGGKK